MDGRIHINLLKKYKSRFEIVNFTFCESHCESTRRGVRDAGGQGRLLIAD